MNIFLLMMIAVLIIVISFQYRNAKNRRSNLIYINEKLKNIIDSSSNEKLMLFTDDKEIISVLIEINELLDYNQKILTDYSKTEIAMKKMLSNISHDLKTPLTVVLGYIETIKLDQNIGKEEREVLLTKVEIKAKEVLELMNKFFDLAKLESGDKEIALSKVNVREICYRNLLEFYDVLTNQGIEVNIDIPQNNIYCLGNEEALNRILGNLISNAMKYGYEGKLLGLSLHCDNDMVAIEIWDKGRGINELHKDRIFERMYTLEDSRNKLYQGSGLGLTITKRLVENMGGLISLESKPYEKTTFTVKLKRIAN